jgi:hypothetical protein
MPGGETPPETPRPPAAGDRGVFGPCEAMPATNSTPAAAKTLDEEVKGRGMGLPAAEDGLTSLQSLTMMQSWRNPEPQPR